MLVATENETTTCVKFKVREEAIQLLPKYMGAVCGEQTTMASVIITGRELSLIDRTTNDNSAARLETSGHCVFLNLRCAVGKDGTKVVGGGAAQSVAVFSLVNFGLQSSIRAAQKTFACANSRKCWQTLQYSAPATTMSREPKTLSRIVPPRAQLLHSSRASHRSCYNFPRVFGSLQTNMTPDSRSQVFDSTGKFETAALRFLRSIPRIPISVPGWVPRWHCAVFLR
ncbi:hypothetical protein J6590_045582 [Homalodisca vitripennis]|nr:hypothetical protein J6590_045582 [Homalodisca vitripennis]